MRYVFITLICAVIIVIGVHEVKRQRQKTMLLDQAERLVSFIRAELHFHSPDCESLYNSAVSNGFDCVRFCDGLLAPVGDFGDNATAELKVFLSSVGTTDTEGQLALCDEYQQRIKRYLDEQRLTEKSKAHVDFAVCLLSVFCVVVLFM